MQGRLVTALGLAWLAMCDVHANNGANQSVPSTLRYRVTQAASAAPAQPKCSGGSLVSGVNCVTQRMEGGNTSGDDETSAAGQAVLNLQVTPMLSVLEDVDYQVRLEVAAKGLDLEGKLKPSTKNQLQTDAAQVITGLRAWKHILDPTEVKTLERDGEVSIEVSGPLQQAQLLKPDQPLWVKVGIEGQAVFVQQTKNGFERVDKLRYFAPFHIEANYNVELGYERITADLSGAASGPITLHKQPFDSAANPGVEANGQSRERGLRSYRSKRLWLQPARSPELELPAHDVEVLTANNGQIDAVVDVFQPKARAEVMAEFLVTDAQVDSAAVDALIATERAAIERRRAATERALANLKERMAAEQTALAKDIDALAEVSDRIDAIDSEVDRVELDLEAEAKRQWDALPDYVRATLSDVQVRLAELEHYATGGRRNAQGQPIQLPPGADVWDLIDANRQQVRDIELQVLPRYQNSATAQALKQELERLLGERTRRHRQGDEIYQRSREREETMLGLAMDLAQREVHLWQVEAELKALTAPGVTRIRLHTGDTRRFEAGIGADAELLALLQANLAQTEADWQAVQAVARRANAVDSAAAAQLKSARQQFADYGDATVALGEQLSDLIFTNALWRAGMEVAEVIAAARDGGVWGSLVEALSKMAQVIVLDEPLLETFDESGLRAQIQGERKSADIKPGAADPMAGYFHAVGGEFAKDTAFEVPAKLGVDQLRQLTGRTAPPPTNPEVGIDSLRQWRRLAEQQKIAQTEFDALATRSSRWQVDTIDAARDLQLQHRFNLLYTQAMHEEAEKDFMRALRQAAANGDALPEGFDAIKDRYKETYRAVRESARTQPMMEQLQRDLVGLDNANRRLGEIGEEVAKVAPTGEAIRNTLKKVGVDAATGLAITAVKEGTKRVIIDASERKAWENYLRTEVQLAAAATHLLLARNQRYNALDAKRVAGEASYNAMLAYMHARRALERYRAGALDALAEAPSPLYSEAFDETDGLITLTVAAAGRPVAAKLKLQGDWGEVDAERLSQQNNDQGVQQFRFAVPSAALNRITPHDLRIAVTVEPAW